jgi:hypothetical protein
MDNIYENTLGSERTVEITFIREMLDKYHSENNIVLDVGGTPTNEVQMKPIRELITENRIDYRVSDFRQSDYRGDFVLYDFGCDKFDICIFLSSLEHFPQCTESDVVFREGYDKKGYEKALSILNDGGLILLTVPFGKQIWQKYHQNYDMGGILKLTEGSEIIESYTYRLKDNTNDKISGKWVIEDPLTMTDILYTDRAYGVGCFVLKKK